MLVVFIHGFGIGFLYRLLLAGERPDRFSGLSAGTLRGQAFATAVVLALLTLHFVEIAAFGFAYHWLGAFERLGDAVFFSVSSYATVGFDDYAIGPRFRLIAAVEGVVGFLLIGWSTAFLVRVLVRVLTDRAEPEV